MEQKLCKNKRSQTFQNSWTRGRQWETTHIPLCFKYTGNPGHLVLTWATKNSRKLARLATKHWR